MTTTLLKETALAVALAAVLIPRALPANPGDLLWTFHCGFSGNMSEDRSSPAIGADGTVYVGGSSRDGAGMVYALDGATGVQKWAQEIGEPNFMRTFTPAIGKDGVVYIGSEGLHLPDQIVFGSVKALDGATGAEKWVRRGEMVYSCGGNLALGTNGTVYVGARSCVYALDGKTGATKWRVAGSQDYYPYTGPAIGRDGTVYVGCADDHVYALNGATGARKWTFVTGNQVRHSPAIGADGTVYLGSDKCYALNGATGATKWLSPLGWAAPAVGADGTVYLGWGALDGETGAQKWRLTEGFNYSSAVLAADGTVYVGNDDHKVRALDAATGAQKWVFVTGGPIHSTPALAEDGTVYVVSDDGRLYALAGSAGLADSPWPKNHHDMRNTGRWETWGSPPEIREQPSRLVLHQGAEGRVTVDASGQPKPSFRWFLNNQPVPGATEATLTIPSVTRADEGTYTVVASNAVGQVTSDPIRALVSNVDPQAFVGLKWEGGNVGAVSLEATAQLDVTVSWHSISNYPASTTTQWYVELDPADAARFYRLNAPVPLQFTTAGWVNGWWLTQPAGTRVRIEMVSAATGWTTWQELTTLVLPASPHLFLDFESLGAPERVYRTTVVP